MQNPAHSLSYQHRIFCDRHPPDPLLSLTSSSEPAMYDVDAKLTNGPFLQLNKPISLAVEIRSILGSPKEIVIHDFQSMLLETTDVRARGSLENQTRSWIIQTMTNLRLSIVAAHDSQDGSVLRVNDGLWSRHRLPSYLAPTFETCNITRIYALVIRLGIEFGANNRRTVEFQFPVYIISSGTDLPRGTLESTDSRCNRDFKEMKV
ncbi:hypothetical protein ASPWEDRAFT_170503 [Aspergillus wentii DTO 134E9]|uniref:Uncharacterized protein n=1 Tax=Aspergillus wentii DTO 134E9 TaxID=1073089 RepID=A0A1L9RPX4_ASPWE|nr:uncharacterized protein ASPWEDRAFT_170503 [Aspergillus wentii DTO 134E9]OJJ37006.1 hypothetical protein ASPWEDRAFT_170503 [Aspergillus wentii DTO 134E9]